VTNYVHLIDSFVILWSGTICNTDQLIIVGDVLQIILLSIMSPITFVEIHKCELFLFVRDAVTLVQAISCALMHYT
jgi:hypothetical protein